MSSLSTFSNIRANVTSTIGLALLVGCSQGFVAAQGPDVHQPVTTEGEFFRGTIRVTGIYEYVEDGEPCLKVSRESSKLFPYWNGTEKVRLCFSNAERALDLLNIRRAVDSIDVESICGVDGQATVRVSGLWTGVGPATRWYTSELIDVSSLGPHSFLKCPPGLEEGK
jgi:hypothetical protein